MLSYQHIFHAGNHADLLKHFVLYQVLCSLNKKDKPYTFFDTHSGSALYDLLDGRSLKTGEAKKAVFPILAAGVKENCPPPLRAFLDFLRDYTSRNFYPGSPEIARAMMRAQDFLVLSERHPQEIEALRENMRGQKTGSPSIQIHYRDGWEMLRALTPPATSRGAVLIDPSYEETSDYVDASRTVCAVHKKWSNGIIMLWYPLLAHRSSDISAMLGEICGEARSQNANIEISDTRLEVYDSREKNLPRLYGSGMLVLNSPWGLREEAGQSAEFIRNEISGLFQSE